MTRFASAGKGSEHEVRASIRTYLEGLRSQMLVLDAQRAGLQAKIDRGQAALTAIDGIGVSTTKSSARQPATPASQTSERKVRVSLTKEAVLDAFRALMDSTQDEGGWLSSSQVALHLGVSVSGLRPHLVVLRAKGDVEINDKFGGLRRWRMKRRTKAPKMTNPTLREDAPVAPSASHAAPAPLPVVTPTPEPVKAPEPVEAAVHAPEPEPATPPRLRVAVPLAAPPLPLAASPATPAPPLADEAEQQARREIVAERREPEPRVARKVAPTPSNPPPIIVQARAPVAKAELIADRRVVKIPMIAERSDRFFCEKLHGSTSAGTCADRQEIAHANPTGAGSVANKARQMKNEFQRTCGRCADGDKVRKQLGITLGLPPPKSPGAPSKTLPG